MTIVFKPNFGQKLALFVYSFIWLLIIPIAITHFLYQLIRRKPGYSLTRLSRFGIESSAKIRTNGLIIHCASVGEVVAIQGLIEQILITQPKLFITITTNTTTGADRVKLLFSARVSHAYLPYDFPFFLKLFLNRRAPSAVLINEMELWPNLCHHCWRENIPIFLINGRMSEKSTKTYQKYPALFKPMFEKLTRIGAQDKRDYQNYLKLGVNPNKLILTNNIKFDLSISAQDLALSKTIKTTFNLDNRKLLVAGSTHEPEEQVLLDAFLALQNKYPDLLLVIVPRHPQRFEKVHQLLKKRKVDTVLISSGFPCTPSTQVLLCDQMGKLRAIYGIADISFVGGSLAQRGGHNALEPAALGVPILMGESRFNNPTICQSLADSGALLTVTNAQQIENACEHWFANTEQRILAGESGKQVLKDNQGAIEQTLKMIGFKHI